MLIIQKNDFKKNISVWIIPDTFVLTIYPVLILLRILGYYLRAQMYISDLHSDTTMDSNSSRRNLV